MINVYLASSFAYMDKDKTEERKSTMEIFQRHLNMLGFEVYNPSKLKIENAWSYSMYDWGNLVFQEDKKQLDNCDFVVFISYGKENNAGSAWEVGYAYALGKKIIMVSMNDAAPESLMMIHSCHACIHGFKDFLNYDFASLPMTKIDCVES